MDNQRIAKQLVKIAKNITSISSVTTTVDDFVKAIQKKFRLSRSDMSGRGSKYEIEADVDIKQLQNLASDMDIHLIVSEGNAVEPHLVQAWLLDNRGQPMNVNFLIYSSLFEKIFTMVTVKEAPTLVVGEELTVNYS